MAAAPGDTGRGAPPPAIACAACKYQRRRCTPDCPLAAYFPHDRPRVFRNAHRLFGVSNILKTLKIAGPVRRDEAMRSIIIESQAWDACPDAGCVPLILELHRMVRHKQLQLRQVQEAIEAYKTRLHQLQAAAAGHHHHSTDGGNDGDGTASGGSDDDRLALEQQMMMMTMAPPPPLQYEDGITMAVDTAMLAPQQQPLLPLPQQDQQLLVGDGTTMMVPSSQSSQHQQQPVFSTIQTPPPPPPPPESYLHNNETVMSYLLVDGPAGNEMLPHGCTSSADSLEKNTMMKAPNNILEDGTTTGFKLQQDDDDAPPMAGGGGADQIR